MITDRLYRAFLFVREYLVVAGPMFEIHYLQKKLSVSISAEMNAPLFTSKDFSGTNVMVDGHILHTIDIGNAVHLLVAECEEEISTNLLWNIPIEMSYSVIHDQPRYAEVGYCFLDDNNNRFKSLEDTVIQLMVSHPYVEGKYHRIQAEKLIWNPATCFEWLSRAEAVLMKLFCASVMSSGEYSFLLCSSQC
jgi:hypothetical protein